MTSAVEHIPIVCKVPPAGWRRLARLAGLFRRRPPRVNPEELPQHLLRDLGLADQGFRSLPDDPRRAAMDWLAR